jgi:hypothetical protein
MDQDGTVDADCSLAKNRSRREKTDKKGTKAALERFKEARHGQRSKFDLSEERNVYDEVDEVEYSKIVRGRQDDDWIIDDGTGYVEDGREIFDDDVDEDQPATKKKRGSLAGAGNKSAKNPNIRPMDSKPSGIREMFAAAATKPKVQKTVSLEDDDILGDIMGELKSNDDSLRPAPVVLQRRSVLGNSRVSGGNEPEVKVKQLPVSNQQKTRTMAVKDPEEISQVRRSSVEPRVISSVKSENENMKPPALIKHQPSVGSQKWKADVAAKTAATSDSTKTVSVADMSDDDISAFESQDIEVNCHLSQNIEDDDELDAMCTDVDVSGIDFNDNFDQESPNTVKTGPALLAGIHDSFISVPRALL